MPSVNVKAEASLETALKKFKTQCQKSGLFSDVKRKQYFVKPSVAKKVKAAAARKRASKKRKRSR